MSVKSSNREAAKTREQVKKEKVQPKAKPASEKRKRVRVRLIPIWLRIVIVALLIVLCLGAGAVVGYSIIGDGKVSDTFKKETWTHILDLVKKE